MMRSLLLAATFVASAPAAAQTVHQHQTVVHQTVVHRTVVRHGGYRHAYHRPRHCTVHYYHHRRVTRCA